MFCRETGYLDLTWILKFVTLNDGSAVSSNTFDQEDFMEYIT